MDNVDRIFELHRAFIARRYPISSDRLAEELECSVPTAKRLVRQMRDLLGAPIEYDRERGGYYLDRNSDHPFELPGLWFSADELYALLTTDRLLAGIQEGLLDEYIAPLRERLADLLHDGHFDYREIDRRVRIVPAAARQMNLPQFRRLAGALVERRRLRVAYHGRERDAATERTLSPQRLIYYRDNWYLDAWCHLRGAIRTFSVDRLHPLEDSGDLAIDISDDELDTHFSNTYGIFAGPARNTAHLRFSPHAAKWVADEDWHPKQTSEVLQDGCYDLHVPYGDPTELVMEVLKYGPDVEVLGPPELRESVAQRVAEAAARYGKQV